MWFWFTSSTLRHNRTTVNHSFVVTVNRVTRANKFVKRNYKGEYRHDYTALKYVPCFFALSYVAHRFRHYSKIAKVVSKPVTVMFSNKSPIERSSKVTWAYFRLRTMFSQCFTILRKSGACAKPKNMIFDLWHLWNQCTIYEMQYLSRRLTSKYKLSILSWLLYSNANINKITN